MIAVNGSKRVWHQKVALPAERQGLKIPTWSGATIVKQVLWKT